MSPCPVCSRPLTTLHARLAHPSEPQARVDARPEWVKRAAERRLPTWIVGGTPS